MEERHDCRKTEKGDSPAEFMERHGESMRRMRFTYQSGDQPLEGYTIQRGIHSGGFGEVYLARSHGGKDVALKRIHHADPDIEIRGVTQCLNLKHPNLISLFDVKKDVHGDCWVVMEYVSGTNLEDVLASFPQGLPLEEVRDWLTGFVSGIAFLHDQGIVHRDLKPANIYRESGVVKVGDVGLSKQFDEQRRKHTQSVGTVYYMAPEVARGQYGPEVDVYSAGVILYELISGKLPFNGESTGEILMKHLVAQPDLTAIPPKLRAPLSRALEKDPAKRTRSVKLLEADFLKALGTPEDAMPIPESAFHSTTTSAKSARPTQSRSYEANRPQHVETRAIKSSTTRRIHRTILFGILIGFGLYILRSNQTIAGDLSKLSIGSLVGMGLIGVVFAKLLFRRSQHEEIGAHQPQSFFRSTQIDLAAEPQSISWLSRWLILNRTLSTSAVISCLLSVGFASLLQAHQIQANQKSPWMPTTAHCAFVASVAVVASSLLLLNQFWIGVSSYTWFERFLTRVVTGLVVGAIAYQLHMFLQVTIPPTAWTQLSTARRASSTAWQTLNLTTLQPNLAGYCGFFGLLFGFRRWSREFNWRRPTAIPVFALFKSLIVAYFVATVMNFPQSYAILWAITLSFSMSLTFCLTDIGFLRRAAS